MKFSSKVFVFACVFCLIFSFSALAQKTRKKAVARPAQTAKTAPPQNFEPQVISTAEETERAENYQPNQPGTGSTPETNITGNPPKKSPTTRETVEQLAAQVQELTNKISTMEAQQRSLLDMERLSRAEQRAEQLRKQLDDSIEKQGNIQARLDQIEYEIKPENIERNASIIGSLRPEELREQRRKALEAERARLQTQLNQAKENQFRLENAIKTADELVDKLRKKVEAEIDGDEVPQTAKPKTKKIADEEDGNN